MGRFDVADVPGRGQPGTGEINFVHLRKVLEAEGYDGLVSFELDPVDGDSDRAPGTAESSSASEPKTTPGVRRIR